jgi:NAD(P)H-flavin reductase
MTRWLPRAKGARVKIRGPFGDCTYCCDDPRQPLVLAATGTGMAPLLGVLRSALAARHEGAIHIYHGARSDELLYARDVLDELCGAHGGLEASYLTPEPEGLTTATSAAVGSRVEAAVLSAVRQAPGCRAFICGNPSFVRSLRRNLYLAGVSLECIHGDAFVSSPAATLQAELEP